MDLSRRSLDIRGEITAPTSVSRSLAEDHTDSIRARKIRLRFCALFPSATIIRSDTSVSIEDSDLRSGSVEHSLLCMLTEHDSGTCGIISETAYGIYARLR